MTLEKSPTKRRDKEPQDNSHSPWAGGWEIHVSFSSFKFKVTGVTSKMVEAGSLANEIHLITRLLGKPSRGSRNPRSYVRLTLDWYPEMILKCDTT